MGQEEPRLITRMKYATRRKNGTIKETRGWWVRIQRVEQGHIVLVKGRFFADLKHGGRAKALAHAKRFLAREKREVRPAKPPGFGPVVPPGHGYVKRSTKLGRPVWKAWVRLEGRKNTSTTAFIDVWGSREAKRMCERWLAEKRRGLEPPH